MNRINKTFTEYFLSFYDEKKGIYPIKGLTTEDVQEGIKTHIATSEIEFIGDSVDREAIRDIILKKKGLY